MPCLGPTQHTFYLSSRHNDIGRKTCQFTSPPRPPLLPSPKRLQLLTPCRAADSSSKDNGNLQPSNPAPSNSSNHETSPPSKMAPAGGSWTAQAKSFLLSNCLPLALTTALLIGVTQPQLGAAAARTQLQTLAVIMVFIISGLQLKQGELGQALRSTGTLAYGLVSILLLSPLLAPLVLALPLEPPALKLGLAVFVCMPTALSSGIAMTQALGGNVAMAILLTVSSNMLGIFTVPLMLPLLLGSAAGGVQLDSWALLRQLIVMVLLPTVAGALARAFVPGVAKAVDNNRPVVSVLSAMCLAAVPWMQVSRAMMNGAASLSITGLAAAAACGVTVHVALLLVNGMAAKALRLGGTDDPVAALGIQQAVVLLSSQKTLPVAVTVITKFSAILGEAAGLAAMAAVFAHLAQILLDSFLVSAWLKRFGRISDGKAKPASA